MSEPTPLDQACSQLPELVAQDAADIAVCERSKANPGDAMTLEEFAAVLDGEDSLRR